MRVNGVVRMVFFLRSFRFHTAPCVGGNSDIPTGAEMEKGPLPAGEEMRLSNDEGFPTIENATFGN